MGQSESKVGSRKVKRLTSIAPRLSPTKCSEAGAAGVSHRFVDDGDTFHWKKKIK
jgi:hypothetical protein